MRTCLTQTHRLVCNGPTIQFLNLNNNQIGDVGLTALANACASGSLAQLEVSSRPTDPFSAQRVLIGALS